MPGPERERGENAGPPTAESRSPAGRRVWRAILDFLVLVVATHSVVLGISFLFFPLPTLRLFGWGYTGAAFWPSQAGLFLLILGGAYAAALRLRPLVWLVIGSKAGAFAFLVASAVWVDAPRIVLYIGCGDGMMGLAVAVAFWRLRSLERLTSGIGVRRPRGG